MKLTINTNNEELNALEDLLTVDYEGNMGQMETDRKKAMGVWQKLVDAASKK